MGGHPPKARKAPIPTGEWRKASVRRGGPWRKLQLALWFALLATLAWWWWFSWTEVPTIHRWEGAIQDWWHPAGGTLEWWQEGDVPFHVGTAFLLVVILDLGRRLYLPGWPPSVAAAGALVLATADELLQGLSPERSCDWHDLVSGATGALVAWLIIAGCGALRPKQRRD